MKPPTLRDPRTRPALLLSLILVVASMRWIASAGGRSELFTADSYLLYQAATMGFNYFELGAVRRGLGGSIVHLLNPDMLVATLMFHVLSAVAVAVAAGLLFRRIAGPPWIRAVFAFTAVTIMLRWAEDAVGRTDLSIAALLAFATLAMTAGRLMLACALVCIGLFIHETSFIFGLPLLAALLLRRGGWSAWRANDKAWAGLAFAVALALYAGMAWLPHVDTQTAIDTVRAKFAAHRFVDWGIYFAVSGSRGVRTSVCQNMIDPNFWLHVGGGLVVLLVIGLALGSRIRAEWRAMLLASLPPFLFLCVVANDNARWITLACFNVWLVAAATPDRHGRSEVPARLAVAAAFALLLLTHPRLGRSQTPMFEASPLLERVSRQLGGPRTPTFAQALQRCDPGWRDALGPAPLR